MYIIYIMENLSSQIQKLTTEVSRLQKFVDTYEAQKATRIQLKNDYNNTYNIYLKKKKDYEDAEKDYKNYMQNNRDNTFLAAGRGYWEDNECAIECQQYGNQFPYFKSDYNLNKVDAWRWNCYCSVPNFDIAKKKLDIMNQKKKESDDALQLSMNIKKKLEEALQEL